MVGGPGLRVTLPAGSSVPICVSAPVCGSSHTSVAPVFVYSVVWTAPCASQVRSSVVYFVPAVVVCFLLMIEALVQRHFVWRRKSASSL